MFTLGTLKYPFVALTGFLVTFIFTQWVMRISPRFGWMDIPHGRHSHKKPTPRAGGIAVFLGFHAACAAIFFMPWSSFDRHLDAVWWRDFLVLSTALLGLGLVDDARGLRPTIKLSGQVAIAICAYAMGMEVNKILGFDLPPAINLLVTVFWFVAIINAFNLIDGMDGVASGLGMIAALGLAGALAFRHYPGDTLVSLGLAAACLAFLRYNFHPASAFLGDSGSMFIGFTLAAIGLTTGSKDAAVATIGVPLLAVGIPVFDTALAVWRRSARSILHASSTTPDSDARAPIFGADNDHLHHRLHRSGLSHRGVAATLYLAAAGLAGAALLSLVFQAHAIGIYLIVFATGTYVAIRHLAHVELWDSGRAIIRGLSLPSNRVVSVVMYPIGDGVLLAAALAVATAFTLPIDTDLQWKNYWFDQVPLWVGLPFLAMFAVGTYRRVWPRARVSEFFSLSASVLLGILIAAGISILAGQFDRDLLVEVYNISPSSDLTVVLGQAPRSGLFPQLVIHACLSILFVTGYRIIPRAVQDGMTLTSLRSATGRPTLVYGTRENSIAFVSIAGRQKLEGLDDLRIVGLIDDDRNLHGRLVNGYKVLGGITDLRELVSRHGVEEIIVTYALAPETLRLLEGVALEAGITLTRWRYDLTPLCGSSQGQAELPGT